MIKNTPIERAKLIENDFRDYLNSTLSIGDKKLNKIFMSELKNTKLFQGPFLSIMHPFKSDKSINTYIEEGMLSKEFLKLSEVDPEMKLYAHQSKAIKAIENNKSIVVATGTGSGKTESFLYPILNDILKDIEAGKDHKGIRAIFLYPVNALVNDQIKRLRAILKDYPQITFGSYTGDTLETRKKVNIQDKKDKQEAESRGEKYAEPLENEIRSRESMREDPPHLMFTNYAMLEYILIRPNDQDIFIDKHTKNWKFMVLDEAHRYQGALGIEMSYLLKRLSGRYKHKPLQYILTSATLGKGQEDISQIVNFAQSLTSAHFDEKDILFAERVSYNQKPTISIAQEDFEKLYKNSDNEEVYANIASKYEVTFKNKNQFLYDLILKDQLFYIVVDYAKAHKAIHFYELLNHINDEIELSKESLIYFIELLSSAFKNGFPLLISKYHIFIRTPQGAFAVIKPQPSLNLTRVKQVEDKKAYEIGVCKFCSSMYYIGHIYERDKFIQNDRVDIYENYGEEETRKSNIQRVDFLLIEEGATNEVSKNVDLVAYELCNKCGNLRKYENVNGKSCQCSKDNKLTVYHVSQENSSLKNNIKKCPVCESTHPAGVVRAFHIQKDEATALLSQMSLKSMYKDYENVSEDDKQFIAFSDSVQQASFFATFLEHNHMRFLRKRLIIEMLNESEGSLHFSQLVEELEDYIRDLKLLDPEQKKDEIFKTEAWVTALTELLKVDGQFSGEGLGLYHFRLKKIKVKRIERKLEELNLKSIESFTIEEIDSLLHIALDVFRTAPAIHYPKYDINKDTLSEELLYRTYDNFVVFRNTLSSDEKDFNNIRSFLPSSTAKYKQKHNKLTRFLGKVLNTEDHDKIIKLAEDIWHLADELDIFEGSKYAHQNKFIDVSNYEIFKSDYKRWYQCQTCLKLTTNNVKHFCPQNNCEGKLKDYQFDEKKMDMGNYYRKQYINKPIERLIVEEHTAQIGKKIGRKHQDQFINKKVNVLSSSTTFEMGIDIGSLDNVFMRNVPPTPANYAQRAGRAGRRNSNAGFVMTYCGVSSHDFTYFNNPKEMIEGVIRPPYFKSSNKKIVVRHISAAALGMFFEENDAYTQSIGEFIYNKGIDKFISFVNSKPQELGEYVDKAILSKSGLKDLEKFRWIDDVVGEDSALMKMKLFIENEIEQLRKSKEEANKEESAAASRRAHNYQKQIDRIKDEKLIEKLSRSVVIPKYGFPVDVVELDIVTEGERSDKFNASRDLSIAISEYAPESEVVIDKVKYTSRYLRFPYNNFDKLRSMYYFECPTCNRVSVDYTVDSDKLLKCQYCGEDSGGINKFVVPSYGFATEDKPSKTKMMKPKKTYASDTKYLGGGISNQDRFDLHETIYVESAKDDSLMSINANPFFVCTKCGYTKIERKKSGLSYFNYKEDHRTRGVYSQKCDNKKLEQMHLAHEFKTDVVKITLEDGLDYSDALSVLYALLDGISISFDIERQDLNGVINVEDGKMQFIIFDNVPGGAGHVKRLLDKSSLIEAFETALDVVSQECCDEETSCYNCLRNFKNQKIHDRLKRGSAKTIIQSLLDRISMEQIVEASSVNKPAPKKINEITLISKNVLLSNNAKSLENIVEYALEDLGFTEEDIQIVSNYLKRNFDIDNEHIYFDSVFKLGDDKFSASLYFVNQKLLIIGDSKIKNLLDETDKNSEFTVLNATDLIERR